MTGSPAQAQLLWSVVKNSVSLAGGRILLALVRFAVALIIVQRGGLALFGEFALILSFIVIAEWLSDFGLADIAVRQIASDSRRRGATMGAFAASKAIQCVLAAAALGAAIALLGYPAPVVRSAWIAGGAVLLYGAVQVYRVQFRAQMMMDRDVGAELLSAAFLLLAIWYVTGTGASLEALTVCYVCSRAVNLAAAALLARGRPQLAFAAGFGPELRVLFQAAIPLGLTGLMVSAYDAMDAIALSRWSTSEELGIFNVATRVTMLAVVTEQALAAAVFPVLARQWSHDRTTFARTFQAVVDWGMVLGGALFCALYAGAQGLAVFVKQDSQAVVTVLQMVSWAILARVVVTLVSPMVVISGRLLYTVWITLAVIAAKWVALTVLASRGATGAAAAYLIAEIGVGLIPTVILCQRAAGMRLNWRVPLTTLAVAAAVAVTSKLVGLEGSLLDGVLAAGLYAAVTAIAGAIRLQPLRQLWASVLSRGRSHS